MPPSLTPAPEVTEALREFCRGLQILYGERLSRVVLFGSHARGDARPNSDVDLLVVLRGVVGTGEEIARTSELRSDFCLNSGTLFSCLYVSEDDYLGRQTPLLTNIRREGLSVA